MILIIGFTHPPTIHFKFSATAYFIAKCDGATSLNTKCDRYYKVPLKIYVVLINSVVIT